MSNEQTGRTLFDFLNDFFKDQKYWLPLIIFLFIVIWAASHLAAQEGTKVSILGLIEYQKSTGDNKVVYKDQTPIYENIPEIEEKKITDTRLYFPPIVEEIKEKYKIDEEIKAGVNQ